MKTYTIFSSSCVGNDFLLSRPGSKCFTTTEEHIAREVYAQEVQALSEEYRQGSDLDYSPTDHEMRHAITCKLIFQEYDETGEEIDVDWLKESDYFYDENF